MVYQVENIARDVRVTLDENKTSEQLIDDEDIDTLSLNDIVRSNIIDGVRAVVNAAPAWLLDGGKWFGDAIHWDETGSGWTLLPDDFMRLIIFKMSDWERPVYEAITAADPEYKRQFSRCKGLRGTPQKPVVAIVNRSVGRVLELFSCKDTENVTIEQAIYYPIPSIDSNGGIAIPERCYRAVVYAVASLVAITMGAQEQGALLNELSKQVLV